MSLGLKKYENEINKAWKAVLDDKDDTNWALFSYDGQSNDLKVISFGKYGLDELQQEFNPGKVSFAFVKVLNPKSNLPCFITISFCGEGAPLNRKSSLPNHSIEIQKFFRYSSLNINAREDEEVEPENILEKIRKSSTTEFDFSIKSEANEKPSPVSTNFVRIRPEKDLKDLNLKEKTEFWSKLEKNSTENGKEEIEKQKESKLNERNLINNQHKIKIRTEFPKVVAQQEQVAKKMDSLKLSNEIINEREKFWAEIDAKEKQHGQSIQRRPEKVKSDNKISHLINRINDKQVMSTLNDPTNNSNSNQVKKINAIDEINLEKKKVLSSIKNSLNSNDKENNEVNNIDEDGLQDEDELNDEIVIHEEDENNKKSFIDDWKLSKETMVNSNEYYKLQPEFCSTSPNSASHQQFLIGQSINEEDEIYDEEYENEYVLDNGLNNYTSYLSKRLSNEPLEDILEEDENLQDEELIEYCQGKGRCAKVLFDYAAADETEISLEPNDIITHIEQIFDTDSWLRGRTKEGREGLFPSNFVSMI